MLSLQIGSNRSGAQCSQDCAVRVWLPGDPSLCRKATFFQSNLSRWLAFKGLFGMWIKSCVFIVWKLLHGANTASNKGLLNLTSLVPVGLPLKSKKWMIRFSIMSFHLTNFPLFSLHWLHIHWACSLHLQYSNMKAVNVLLFICFGPCTNITAFGQLAIQQ